MCLSVRFGYSCGRAPYGDRDMGMTDASTMHCLDMNRGSSLVWSGLFGHVLEGSIRQARRSTCRSMRSVQRLHIDSCSMFAQSSPRRFPTCPSLIPFGAA